MAEKLARQRFVDSILIALQDHLQLLRNASELLHEFLGCVGRQFPAQLAEVESDQHERRQLARECFSRSDSNFRAGVRQDRAGGFASDHGADDIADGQRLGAFLLGFALGRKRVGGFAGLADADDERAIAHNGIAVAELAAVIHFHGNPGQAFDHEFTRQTGVPTGAAGDDLDVAEIAEVLLADLHLIEENLAGFLGDAAQHGVSDGAGLLENFLEHEMLEAALFRSYGIPGDVMHLRLDRFTFSVSDLNAFRCEDRDVSVGEEENVARVREDAGNIAGNKVFGLAQADDHARTTARCYNVARILSRKDHQRVATTQTLDRFAHSAFERAAIHILLDQMRHDLGIGLGDELMPFLFEFLLELQVIFDDAIVHNDDFALTVAMRMGIFLCRPAMRGPARVSEAIDPIDGIVADGLFEIRQFAGGATNLHMPVLANDGDACGIVPAIFQASKAVQNEGYDFLRADISDNATHDRVS